MSDGAVGRGACSHPRQVCSADAANCAVSVADGLEGWNVRCEADSAKATRPAPATMGTLSVRHGAAAWHTCKCTVCGL